MSKIGIKFVEGGKIYNAEVEENKYKDGDRVVVESVRGLEIAYICSPTNAEDKTEIVAVLRLVTAEDEKKYEDLKKQEKKVVDLTNELIHKYNLQMKLVDASYTLDGSKVIINYVCEDRVDFRELVKDLASQLKVRIELRQIGIRDQAKKIGGIGFCGKECCCKKYLNDFDKVSIKMAKTQGLSLNPTKISGICGRLMCCLSYENEFYAEASSKMPKLNARVKTPDGVGSVIYNNILKQLVTVKIENDNDTKINEYTLDQIVIVPKDNVPFKNNKPAKEENKDRNSNSAKNQKIEENKKVEETRNTKNEDNKNITSSKPNKKHKKFRKYDKPIKKQ